MNAENTTGASAGRDPENVDETFNGVSPNVIEERIKANLQPLNERISTLIELLNQLVKETLARNSATAGPRAQQTQSRPSFSSELGTSRTPSGSANGSTGFPPIRRLKGTCFDIVLLEEGYCRDFSIKNLQFFQQSFYKFEIASN